MTSAVSGIRAHQTWLDVSAHNIANASTEGFDPQRVTMSARQPNGVDAVVTQPRRPASPAGEPQFSGVDLPAETIAQMLALRGAQANMTAYRTGEEMSNYLLDVWA